MYVIVVYDVSVEKVNKLRIFLKQYLNWVQNSVFEGEMTKAELYTIEKNIKELINPLSDSVRMYILRSDKYLEQKELGTSRVDLSDII